MKRPILVTGARGQLGRAFLVELRKRDLPVLALGKERLDITDRQSVIETFRDVSPSVCINCAAYTAVDRAEEETDLAFKVNHLGVENLVEACKEVGAVLVHFSTDYVFDGTLGRPLTEEDEPNPLNAYGRSKLAGEVAALKLRESLVIRTSWLFSRFGRNFVKTILRIAERKQRLEVVSDQIGCPTYCPDLVDATMRLLDLGARGLFHVASGGKASWYDLAKLSLEIAGIRAELIPIGSDRLSRPAKRPRYSVLDTSKALSFGVSLPSWQSGLQRMLEVSCGSS